MASRHDMRQFGLNARAIRNLANLQRGAMLKGLLNNEDVAMQEKLDHLATAEEAEFEDITACRRNCAVLLTIARPLAEECAYFVENPDGFDLEFDGQEVSALKAELTKLCVELEARAGYPEPYKNAKAEAMRTKLERNLVPKLAKSIPRWAERLRFARATVLRLRKPAKLFQEPEPEPEPEPEETEFGVWDAPAEYNPPAQDKEELALLMAMGWNPDPDAGAPVDIDQVDPWRPETAVEAVPKKKKKKKKKKKTKQGVPNPTPSAPST